jgi:tRNA 2-thiouridine synthesizing protein A
MPEHNVAKILDVKGLPCPMPVVKISQEIGTIEVGEIMEVHATDPGSLSDFPAWAETSGNEILETNQIDGMIQFFVKRVK